MQITQPDISTGSMLARVQGRGRSILRMVTANRKIAIGLGVILFFALVALLAPLIAPGDPQSTNGPLAQAPTLQHLLGTTSRGEDVYTQMVHGTQLSLLVGFVSAFISTFLQVVFGLTAGYFGGTIDDILSLIINVFLVIPGVPLALVIGSFANSSTSPLKGVGLLIPLLAFTTWSYGARVLRAQTFSIKEREFVAAARTSGENSFRLIFAEIMPNEIALVGSNFVGTFVYTVTAEVALEFLGLGDITHSSWGVMLFWAQSGHAFLAGYWWWFVPPGLCVALLCSALTFVNYGIDELANPRLRVDKPPRPIKGTKRQSVPTEEKDAVIA